MHLTYSSKHAVSIRCLYQAVRTLGRGIAVRQTDHDRIEALQNLVILSVNQMKIIEHYFYQPPLSSSQKKIASVYKSEVY